MFPLEGPELESTATFPLSGEGLRNWLRTSGQPLFREFDSGAELLNFLRDNGVAIRTQDFYSIRNQVLNTAAQVINNDVSLAVLGEQYPQSNIPMGLTIFDHGYDLSQNFLYRYRIETINPSTLDVQYEYMAVGSDRQLTFEEANDLISVMFTGEYVDPGYNVTDVSLSAAFGRPELIK